MLQATNYKTKGRLSKLVSLIGPHLPGVTHLCGSLGVKKKRKVKFINNDDNKYIRVVNLFAIIKRDWLVCHGRLRSVIKAIYIKCNQIIYTVPLWSSCFTYLPK